MKIAFSTLGCPNWSFSDIFSTAMDLGFNAIEMRGVGNQIYMPLVPEFSEKNINKTKSRFAKSGLEIAVFSSGADFSDKPNIQFAINEAQDYVNLASEFGSEYVRVLADGNIHALSQIDDNFIAEKLSKLCDYAKDKDVKILVETNGVFSDSLRAAKLVENVGKDNLFLIWDLHHTYRCAGETPEQTLKNIGTYIRHVHLKDSLMIDGKSAYRLVGDGDLPIKAAIDGLNDIGYKGYLCLEWVKRWSMDLPEPGIVFPQYIQYIKALLKQL